MHPEPREQKMNVGNPLGDLLVGLNIFTEMGFYCYNILDPVSLNLL